MTAVDRLQETKRFTDEMLDWVRGRGRVIIIVHDNPDPDCFASALALRHLFVMKLNKEAVITFSGMIGRSENLAMAKKLEVPLTPLGVADLHDYQTVCMLDTQPGTGNNSLPADARVDIVIDHHPLREATKSCRWVDVRDEYGVTATILYEYLLAQGVGIGTKLATALFYAIKSETQDLGREANLPDREAYHRLFPLTNKRLLNAITHPKLPREYFQTVFQALSRSRLYGKVLVANLRDIIYPDMVAEMADFLLRLEEVDTVLVMGRYNDEVNISMRTSRHELNAGEIIRKLVAGMGTAGGHGMTAGGKLSAAPADLSGLMRLERILTRRLRELLGEMSERPIRLLG